MIFISIQPFAPKKLFAAVAAIACLSTASCFADAMYLSAKAEAATRKMDRNPSLEAASAVKMQRLLLEPCEHAVDLRGAA